MKYIPEDFTEFLYWLKDATEVRWSQIPTEDNEYYQSLHGAKWIGMEDTEITALEERYGITFAADHRLFLKILHVPDKKVAETFDDDGVATTTYSNLFYNWFTDEQQIREKLNWPYRTILRDVESSVWLKSWGPKPDSAEERIRIYNTWYTAAPKLAPLTSHRFILSDDTLAYRPVLSIWGSDIIAYGWNLRHFLIKEFVDDLGLLVSVYDEEDACDYLENGPEVKAIYEEGKKYACNKDLPYWKEMIMYWSSGWSSFGLEYPRYTQSGPQQIVKADDSNIPKLFEDHND